MTACSAWTSGGSSCGGTYQGRSISDVVCPRSCGRCTGSRANCFPDDTDMLGEEINFAGWGQSREGCQRLCQDNSSCVFSVRLDTDNPNDWNWWQCRLKRFPVTGGGSSDRGQNGFVSAVDQTCWARTNSGNYYCLDNYYVSGDDADGSGKCSLWSGLTEDQCRQACDQMSGCKFYTYRTDGNCALRGNPFRGSCGWTQRDDRARRTCFMVN
ncbi:hypothetical protein HYH03_018446 [Edaphochlamys debaryana]|uniref:Apple domain-containing protein n=1 Tax=Edaphochlamys debaryana TaxID=47281 RepID=A0A835XFW5_9CHLO|nr:hypothetical protein HYH03_018446 [Edaphochlamys debaryana]|eukprot:KAG2482639.1 hypothetical protein HYH03_018446 [Edaphochlamys debaryana]